MRLTTTAALVVALTATTALHATPFTYVDHWPDGTSETETEVVVPDNTTAAIATAEDVARVARLTSISIGSGAVVKYTASTALTLSAELSGTGTFIGENSAMLTIAADNSGLTAPGHFNFTNAQVLVSHEDGLGAAASGRADFFFGANSLLDFVANANGVYTNKVQMKVDTYLGSGKLRIGISPRTGRLVQCADFLGSSNTGGQKNVRIDGTIEFVGCKVYTTPDYLYFVAAGGTSDLYFSEGCTPTCRYCLFAYDTNLRVHLNGSCPANFGYMYLYCDRANTMANMNGYQFGGSVLDLQGYDQTMNYFNNTYSGAPTVSGTTAKFSVKSASPAMLTLASNTTRTNAVAFTGAAGLCHNNTATLALANAVSTSTNLLDVAKGRVALIWNAGWNGDVNVADNAVLELKSTKSITNGTSRLVVAERGSLLLYNTAVCMVGSANIAGTELAQGTIYSVAQLRDEMHLPVDGDDDAMLTVQGGSGWNGWPDGGGEVSIPADLTVYVSDADVPKVSALSAILLLSGSRVICTNATVPLLLNAAVSGYGTIEAVDSAGLILNGDNSSLRTPGTFWLTNTPVVVSNRYGLGSVDTAMVRFFYGDQNCDALLFRDAGLVVDAPITIWATNSAQRVFGPESADDTLIISNSFRFPLGKSGTANYDPTIYFRNKVRLAGGVFGTNGAGSGCHLYTCKKGDYAEVWFDSGVKPSWYYWFASDILYHLGWEDISQAYLAVTYLHGGRMVCERDNLFTKFYTGYGSGQDNAAQPSYLDLNGHDQELSHFGKMYNSATVGTIVTSAVPATVTVKNKNNSTDASLCSCKANFQGAAAFTYSWTGTNEFTTLFSKTTGALTIEKGTFRLANGAGWGGTNVFVKSGARLVVSAASMPRAFGNKALLGHQPRTKLDIEGGGTLELFAAAKPAVVRSFVYNSTQMPAGLYTSASGVGIAGGGSLWVRSSADGEPGNIIMIR